MDKMVISFLPNGTVQHTLKDSFLNPFPGQKRRIERMSDIEHSEELDAFFIHLRVIHTKDLLVTMSGPITYSDCMRFKVEDYKRYEHFIDLNGVLHFKKYEDAVAVEIALINAMRLAGYTFPH